MSSIGQARRGRLNRTNVELKLENGLDSMSGESVLIEPTWN